MKVLSLFDGISCARVALDKLGVNIEKYYASEIDKYAITIAQKNYPDTIQLGDITKITADMVGDIDLMIGGSPCQDLSIAKKNREGLDGKRSGLFWEYVRLLKEVKPKYFVLENVASMPAQAKQTISEIMGVEPIMINAALVSAQNRKRLFWTNIPNVDLPEDRGIVLKDILENGYVDRDKSYCVDANYSRATLSDYVKRGKRQLVIRAGQINGNTAQSGRVYSVDGKSVALQANGGGMGAKTGLYLTPRAGRMIGRKLDDNGVRKDYSDIKSKQYLEINENPGKTNALTTVTKDNVIFDEPIVRMLTPIECERLQCLADNYTEGVSNTQRYKCLGNAFNCEVIKHILKNI